MFLLCCVLTAAEGRILARTETRQTVLFLPRRLRAWLAWRSVATRTFLW